MRLVVDSSVAVKWAVKEEAQDAALGILAAPSPPLAPSFVLVEAANVLWKKVVRGELTADQTSDGLHIIRRAIPELVPDTKLLEGVLRAAVELSHPVYDCLYLSCAERLNLDLVTADRKLFNKTRNTRFAGRVQLLDSMDSA